MSRPPSSPSACDARGQHRVANTSGRNADNRRVTTPPALVKIVYPVGGRQEEAFETALTGMLKDGETSPGWLGVDVVRPASDGAYVRDWLILFRFRSDADLADWRASPAAISWRTRIGALTAGAPLVERIQGAGAWFSPPDRAESSKPKWKMVTLTSFVIDPFILALPVLLAPLVEGAPEWLATLVNVLIMIPLMTWLIMPAVTRLLKNLLYADVDIGTNLKIR